MEPFEEGTETVQSFAYEKRGNSAVIWRCFSRDTKAVIPEQIDGLLVTELAPYAFSAHMEEQEFQRRLQAGQIQVSRGILGEDAGSKEALPALCGAHLTELVLPKSIVRIGRYCFYNCDRLQTLCFGGALRDWGTGVFTGCHHITKLRVSVAEDGISTLKDVLDEVREQLCVEYEEMTAAENAKRRKAVLWYPEFYEEGVENTPARILETRIHGSGMMYRNCFSGRRMDFRQYDALFPYARTLETPRLAAGMAMWRLREPLELAERAKVQYEMYVCEQPVEFASLLTDTKDMEGVRWICALFVKEPAVLEQFLEALAKQAGRAHFTEAMSYVMDYRHAHAGPVRRRKRLEL